MSNRKTNVTKKCSSINIQVKALALEPYSLPKKKVNKKSVIYNKSDESLKQCTKFVKSCALNEPSFWTIFPRNNTTKKVVDRRNKGFSLRNQCVLV